MEREKFFKLAFLLIGVTLVVSMAIFLDLNRAIVYNELIALDLIPKPEKLTELYFNNNANLPGTVTNNQPISFTFVIHNLETTDYRYVYTVSVIANGNRRIIDRGDILVKNDQYYEKDEKFTLTNASGRQEVVVELINKQQSIDFWVGDSK